ncbi:MAG: hypothetical protein PF637_10980 [Spirochaetes bacterium]|jgi:predicted Fe-Mo cluster-binding NifX family protein|nr:hypothetical protein [Spirochaetota bacterium]
MRLAIPVSGCHDHLNETVMNSFTDTDYLGIYDSDTDSFEIVSSSELQKNGSSSIVDIFACLKITSVISNSLQPRAYYLFYCNDIQVYTSDTSSLKECIQKYKNNSLSVITEENIVFPTCGDSCDSCSSASCG